MRHPPIQQPLGTGFLLFITRSMVDDDVKHLHEARMNEADEETPGFHLSPKSVRSWKTCVTNRSLSLLQQSLPTASLRLPLA